MCSKHQILDMACPSFRNNGICRLINEERLKCNKSYRLYDNWFLKVFCVDDKE